VQPERYVLSMRCNCTAGEVKELLAKAQEQMGGPNV
jgi:hypothetical protein